MAYNNTLNYTILLFKFGAYVPKKKRTDRLVAICFRLPEKEFFSVFRRKVRSVWKRAKYWITDVENKTGIDARRVMSGRYITLNVNG